MVLLLQWFSNRILFLKHVATFFSVNIRKKNISRILLRNQNEAPIYYLGLLLPICGNVALKSRFRLHNTCFWYNGSFSGNCVQNLHLSPQFINHFATAYFLDKMVHILVEEAFARIFFPRITVIATDSITNRGVLRII